jgi:hypothetical protein
MCQIVRNLSLELRSTIHKLAQSQHVAGHVNGRRNVPAALGGTYDIEERQASCRVGGAEIAWRIWSRSIRAPYKSG